MPPAGCIAGIINTEIYPEVETSYFPRPISSSLERNWWITYFETQLWDTLNSQEKSLTHPLWPLQVARKAFQVGQQIGT